MTTTIAYTTQAVEPTRRFEYWVDVVCRHCVPATSKQLDSRPFDGQLQITHVGAVEIYKMVAPLHWWSRDTIHLKRNPDDDLWIAYMEEGQGVLSQQGREAQVCNGNLVLYDAARHFEFTLATKGIYLVRLPRRSMVMRCPGAERLTAHVINGNHAGALSLRLMIQEAVNIDFENMRPNAEAQFGSTLLDLAAMTLEFDATNVEPRSERDFYSRIVTYIRQHIEDTDLCLENIAKAHCVSSRTITRVFARRKQTAMGVVWRLRLEEAQNALAEGRARTVTEAAFSNGFSDLSHFSRVFRKTFGHAPHTLIRD